MLHPDSMLQISEQHYITTTMLNKDKDGVAQARLLTTSKSNERKTNDA
jgi:hypothetical protein